MSDSENESIQDLLECAEEYENLMREKLKSEEKKHDAQKQAENFLSNKYKRKSNIGRSDGINELPMEKVIFGDKEGLLRNMAAAVGEELKRDDDEVEPADEEHAKSSLKRKPAWTDADDTEITVGDVKRSQKYAHISKERAYQDYLAAQYMRTIPQPLWASLDKKKKDGEDDEDEALLQTVGFVAKPDTSALPQSHIQIKRLKDLNRATYAEGSITSVQFIPKSTATLVAGTSGIATIYSIDGVKNEKLHSMRFEHFPIICAHLKPCGTKAVFGSIRRHYFIYDLLTAKEIKYKLPSEITNMKNFKLSPCGRYLAVAGRFGNVYLFDATSQELIHTFNQQNDVASMCFTADSKNLICSSKSSKINIFSIIAQRLAHSFTDEGCLNGSALDLSLDQRLLATGSMEGVVNVYDYQKVQVSRAPKPEKSFLNLRTSISDVKFNNTAEALAMCSAEVASAVKLAHFPSATVFANFPTNGSGIGKIRLMEFSPNSGYLALGSVGKPVNLLRLKHYKYY